MKSMGQLYQKAQWSRYTILESWPMALFSTQASIVVSLCNSKLALVKLFQAGIRVSASSRKDRRPL